MHVALIRGKLGAYALACLTASCVFDADDRCGPDQRYDEGGDYCVCEAGLVVAEDGSGCVPCGDNEVIEGDGCVCEEGYGRVDEGGSCEELPDGLGMPCDDDEDCTSDTAPACATDTLGEGYCTTTGCEDDDDCTSGYACAADDTGLCTRPPTGQGRSCETDGDCEGVEADYCEAVLTRQCLVSECAPSGECHGAWVCCDFTSLGFTSLCVSPDELMDGDCPFGAELVEGP